MTGQAPGRWWLGAGLALGAVIAVLVLPVGSQGAIAVSVTASLLAVLALGWAVIRMPRSQWAVWWLLWAFIALHVLADTLYTIQDHVLDVAPFPGPADAVYLLGYGFGIAGLVVLTRRLRPSSDLEAWIDAAFIAFALMAVGTALFVSPRMGDEVPVGAADVLSLLYPAIDLIMLGVLVLLITERPSRASVSLVLVSASILLFVVADFTYSLIAWGGVDVESPALDGVYLAGVLVMCLAGTHPSARQVDDPGRDEAPLLRGRGASIVRVAVIVVAVVAAPAMALYVDLQEQHGLSRLLALMTIIIVLLLTLRVTVLLRRSNIQAALLADQARTDALTRLPNRRTWDYQLERSAADATRVGESLVVAMIDLDHFKRFNDAHGHQAGDVVLANAARAWQQAIGDRGFLARYGGEEFAVLLPGVTLPSAHSLLERVRAVTPEPLTASVGLAVCERGESALDAVHRADLALYQAKASGRNQVMVAESGIDADVLAGAMRLPGSSEPLLGSEELLRQMLEDSSDIVYRTSGLDIEWISPSVTKHLGWPAEELIGSPAASLLSPHQDQGWIAENRRRLLAGETVYQELLLRCSDGSERWFAGTAHPTSQNGHVTGFVVTMNDIHHRWIARTELAAMEELVRVASESSRQGVMLLDGRGRIVEVNAAMREFLQMASPQLVGTNWEAIVHPDDLGFQREMALRLREGHVDSYRVSNRFVRADGSVAYGEASVAAVRTVDRSLHRIVVQVLDTTEQTLEHERLFELSTVDPLTGALSRTAALNRMDELLAEQAAGGAEVGILLMEMETLRLVNESLGHEAGDELVAVFGERLMDEVGPLIPVGRSGKRFMVISTAHSDTGGLLDMARRIQAVQAQEVTVGGRRLEPTCCVGVVIAREGATALSVLRDAHVALSEARRDGAGGLSVFDEGMASVAERRLVVEEQLRDALISEEFLVEYQPIVRLDSGRIEGFEALLRWRHPIEGLRPPSDFLPIAEDSRLIRRIGPWVMQRVCADVAAHPALLRSVSVNVSAVELEDADWLPRYLEVVRESGVDPTRLVLEITETAVFSTPRDMRREFTAVRDAGLRVAVDDFGTGYSSLALLRDLPVTGLKLDLSFVASMGAEEGGSEALVGALAGLAQALGLTMIAEGIETPEQAARLRWLGWTFGQGYHFGRPAPLAHWIDLAV